MKVCPRCLEIKSYDDFSRYSGTRDGLQAWCKACSLDYLKMRRQGQALLRRTRPKTKTCSKCGEEKRLKEYAYLNAPDVRYDSCIDCMAAEARLKSANAGTDDVGYIGNTSKGEIMPAKTKPCTRCKKRRKVESFYRDKTTKDGLSTWCKECTKDYDRAYRERKKAEAS